MVNNGISGRKVIVGPEKGNFQGRPHNDHQIDSGRVQIDKW
jgi:hypothetical protein